MNKEPLKFDEIGIWSEIKLDIIEQYGKAYTSTFAHFPNLKKYYIDAFSGAGQHVAKKTKEQVEGSPTRALKVRPAFNGYYFIDINGKKTDFLRAICGDRRDVAIHTGDSNEILIKTVLPKIQYAKSTRALCLLDPYALQLDWEVILQAGQSKAVDMFLNFPVMDINRNAIWHHPEKVPQDGIERMNRFWGDDSWRDVAYVESGQQNLFGKPDKIKQSNETIVAAFRDRLKKVAGFNFIPDPLPMRNSKNAVVYYLFLASPKAVAQKIITHIFNTYR